MASSIFGFPSLSFSDIFHWVAWLCVFYLLYTAYSLYLRRKQLQKIFRSFPGPETHWLYGNAHVLKQDGTDLDTLSSYGRTFEYAFPMWFGRYTASLTIYHPDYARTILSRQDPKDNFAYYFITPWIGKGLLVLSGAKWFQHRKLLTPGFHYDVLKPYVGVMSDCANVMLDKWEYLVSEKKSIELFHHVSLMTLDTIMKCAFSYQSNCQDDSDSEYIKAVYELSYLVNYRFRFFPYHSDLIFYLSPHGYRFRRALRTAHEHTNDVIKRRKESLKQNTELEKVKQKRHLDFLDILLYAKEQESQEDMFTSRPALPPLARKKKRSLDSATCSFLDKAVSALQNKSDESDGFGVMIANKHRKMTDQQREFAERLVLEVLAKGIRGELSAKTKLIEEQPPTTYQAPMHFAQTQASNHQAGQWQYPSSQVHSSSWGPTYTNI